MTNVATLQTAADLSASITAQGVSSLVPSGVVMAYAGATAPTGWLLCNGSAVSRTTYADLFAAISTAHGYGDNSTTFNIPDYRGRFIRGRDGAIARDPDRAGRTAAATGGNTGDNVGSVQGTATQDHGHTIPAREGSSGTYYTGSHHLLGRTAFSDGGLGTAVGANPNEPTLGGSMTIQAYKGLGYTPTSSTETRPTNAYVNYIIKI